jgi:hypothetical protein
MYLFSSAIFAVRVGSVASVMVVGATRHSYPGHRDRRRRDRSAVRGAAETLLPIPGKKRKEAVAKPVVEGGPSASGFSIRTTRSYGDSSAPPSIAHASSAGASLSAREKREK